MSEMNAALAWKVQGEDLARRFAGRREIPLKDMDQAKAFLEEGLGRVNVSGMQKRKILKVMQNPARYPVKTLRKIIVTLLGKAEN